LAGRSLRGHHGQIGSIFVSAGGYRSKSQPPVGRRLSGREILQQVRACGFCPEFRLSVRSVHFSVQLSVHKASQGRRSPDPGHTFSSTFARARSSRVEANCPLVHWAYDSGVQRRTPCFFRGVFFFSSPERPVSPSMTSSGIAAMNRADNRSTDSHGLFNVLTGASWPPLANGHRGRKKYICMT